MYRRLALLAGGLALLCTAPLAAQDAALSQMYGSGVHAFFSQEYRQAYDHFTAAVDAGTQDPRCHYFRGLTYLHLGREEEAKMDFEQASRLEAEDVNEFYNVGRALERVQGSVRLTVELYRAKARLEALKRAEALRQQRYGELRAAEQRVLETQAASAPATPPEVPAAPQPATIDDPFGVGPAQPPGAGPVAPAQPAPGMAEPAEAPALAPEPPALAPQTDPFSAVPAPAGAGQDPFAVQPAGQPAAAEPAGAEVPEGTTGSGVFGAIGRALSKAVTEGEEGAAAPSDDPFGAAPAAGQPAAAPAGAEPMAPAGDPFGAAPAVEQPAAAEPAAPAGDPFGAAPAAGEPAAAPAGAEPTAPGGDPFGAAPAAGQPAAAPAGAEPMAPGGDPFGAAPAAGQPAAAPAGAEPMAPGGDPFGAAPAAGQPPAAEPAAPAGDPFMEEKEQPAEQPAPKASDDPFA